MEAAYAEYSENYKSKVHGGWGGAARRWGPRPFEGAWKGLEKGVALGMNLGGWAVWWGQPKKRPEGLLGPHLDSPTVQGAEQWGS